AFAAARAGGMAAIDGWLRVRQARVTRDTAVAFRLLTDLPAAAGRDAALARARTLLLAADTQRAVDAFAQTGKGLDVARLARASSSASTIRGRSRRSRGSPRPIPATRPRPPRSTSWATRWTAAAKPPARSAGSPS